MRTARFSGRLWVRVGGGGHVCLWYPGGVCLWSEGCASGLGEACMPLVLGGYVCLWYPGGYVCIWSRGCLPHTPSFHHTFNQKPPFTTHLLHQAARQEVTHTHTQNTHTVNRMTNRCKNNLPATSLAGGKNQGVLVRKKWHVQF